VTIHVTEAPGLEGIEHSAPSEQHALHRGPPPDDATPRDTADYAELRRLVVERGLLERQPVYYAMKFTTLALMLAVGLVILANAGSLPGWVQALNVVYLAFVFGQTGLLGHDVGHKQVFRSQRLAHVVGIVLGNLLLGIGRGWWLESHNGAHHNNPNHMGLDPNIEFYVLAFTPEQGRRKPPVLQWIIRHQAKLVAFFACLQTVSLHSQTVDFLQRWWRRRTVDCAIELAALVVHVVLYVGIIVVALGPAAGLAFILVHRALAGLYLASIFAPNHKGMPLVYGAGRPDFLHEQVLTARNIHGNPLTDFWYGGLNYQIEHHLFPSLPRNRLSRAQPLVRDYCVEHRLAYHATSLGGAYREMFRQFQHVSDVLNQERAAAAGLSAAR
jgi:fatty acid desaturase